jgi:hypothetical protein
MGLVDGDVERAGHPVRERPVDERDPEALGQSATDEAALGTVGR